MTPLVRGIASRRLIRAIVLLMAFLNLAALNQAAPARAADDDFQHRTGLQEDVAAGRGGLCRAPEGI